MEGGRLSKQTRIYGHVSNNYLVNAMFDSILVSLIRSDEIILSEESCIILLRCIDNWVCRPGPLYRGEVYSQYEPSR